MSDNRPIGFFDSGLGGLTCIPHLMQALPHERIIYFGDTARTPYGSKSPETIRRFSRQIADFLVKNDVKMIVIACNTVTSTCLEDLQARHPQIPIAGIIDPAAKKAAMTAHPDQPIGVIGTKVTIKNKAYDQAIKSYHAGLRIFGTACPVFVPLIEEGIIDSSIMDMAVRHYLDSFLSVNRIGTLVLGCTHYPLIRDNLEALYPNLTLIDPSAEIIPFIQSILTERNELACASQQEQSRSAQPDQGYGAQAGHMFYASDLSENFINMINRIFANTTYTAAFKSFDLESLDG